MAFIETIDDERATKTEARLLAEHREQLGFVPNFVRLFARRPAAYAAWNALKGAVTATMDLRRYELATLAAARELRSSYCALAHGSLLAERFVAPDTVRALALDRHPAGLDAVDLAVVGLAAKVAADASSVTEDDIERLRQLGLSDDEIFDVVLAAAARCFFSKALDALGCLPDARYRDLEPELRDALTVGRPIASS